MLDILLIISYLLVGETKYILTQEVVESAEILGGRNSWDFIWIFTFYSRLVESFKLLWEVPFLKVIDDGHMKDQIAIYRFNLMSHSIEEIFFRLRHPLSISLMETSPEWALIVTRQCCLPCCRWPRLLEWYFLLFKVKASFHCFTEKIILCTCWNMTVIKTSLLSTQFILVLLNSYRCWIATFLWGFG